MDKVNASQTPIASRSFRVVYNSFFNFFLTYSQHVRAKRRKKRRKTVSANIGSNVSFEKAETACELPEKFVQVGRETDSSSTCSTLDQRDPYLLIVFDWDDTLFPTTWSVHDPRCSEEARGWCEDAYAVLTKEANELFVLENEYYF